MDFLIEEVFRRQTERVQTFLIGTSILDRLAGPLCDVVLSAPAGSGQETLEYLQRSNLFVVPLDSERRWYRYHHLFADLLRQQLGRRPAMGAAGLHARASRWYEDNGMEIEAFRHAAAANDVERAERLVEGDGKPLYFRGVTAPVLQWLESLPAAAMDARPSLWVTFASALMLSGRPDGVEDRLRAAEAALNGRVDGGAPGDLEGRMAVLRAMVAASQNRVDIMRAHHLRALELLRPDDLSFRAFNTLTRGYSSRLQGDSPGAERAFAEVMSFGLASGNSTLAVAAASSLGGAQEYENQLPSAAETYRRILRIVADPASMYNYEANLGLARISYEWNDLDAAQQHGEQSAQLAPQIECMSTAASLVLLARVRLARLDAAGAAALLAEAAEAARLDRFGDAMPEVAAAEVIVLLHQGNVAAAARKAERFDLPASRAWVRLAQGNPSAALAALDAPLRRAEAGGSANERLKLAVLRALAFDARGAGDMAVQLPGEALALAEPGGFIRLFVDEGVPMAGLLSRALAHGIVTGYAGNLLAAFPAPPARPASASVRMPAEALSQREMDILTLIARGCTNHEIAERLFLAASTVKGHNQSIFGKLQVRRRTEAIARARELGLV